MIRRFLLSALVAAFAVTAVNVNAGSFTVTPVFVGAFDDAFTPLPGYDPATSGTPAILQYDFKVNFTPTGTETFGAVVFDITLGGTISEAAALPGWQAHNPQVDSNGALPGGLVPLFANAGDFGTPGDLKNITAGIAANLTANPTIDPRMKVGRGESVMGIDLDLLGNLYLSWDGQSSATINVEVKEGGYRNAADGMLIVDPNPTFTGGLIELGDVTPPGGVFESTPTGAGGGVLDFGFGPNTRTINLAVRNVGADGSTVVVDDFTITGADASLFSLPGFAPLTLPSGGVNSNIAVQFNGIGTPGVYNATLTLLDEAGDTLGTYALTAAVPEPSTVALAGLSLVGLVGFLRRRG